MPAWLTGKVLPHKRLCSCKQTSEGGGLPPGLDTLPLWHVGDALSQPAVAAQLLRKNSFSQYLWNQEEALEPFGSRGGMPLVDCKERPGSSLAKTALATAASGRGGQLRGEGE